MRDEELHRFINLFISRRDDYAVQQETGRYWRANRPLAFSTVKRHLLGVETIGTYVIDEGGQCRFAVFDADTDEGKAALIQLEQRFAQEGIPSYLEGSRRGCHLWVFCSRLIPASQLRRWLLPFCPAGVEFYPKQDEGRGYGSLIRVPLGVHRVTNCRYWFFSHRSLGQLSHVYAHSVEDSLLWLSQVRRATVPDEAQLPTGSSAPPQDTPPSLAKEAHSTTPPSPLVSIRAWCDAQDPYAVIGRYVTLDRRGLGCCPFGEHHSDGKDSHPSLRVYRPTRSGGSCWYCYVWQRGGTLFDFLCSYHQVDARRLWQHILAGESF